MSDSFLRSMGEHKRSPTNEKLIAGGFFPPGYAQYRFNNGTILKSYLFSSKGIYTEKVVQNPYTVKDYFTYYRNGRVFNRKGFWDEELDNFTAYNTGEIGTSSDSIVQIYRADDVLMYASRSGFVGRSTDNGLNWTNGAAFPRLGTGICLPALVVRGSNIYVVFFDRQRFVPVNSFDFLYYLDYRVIFSSDYGATWTHISDLTVASADTINSGSTYWSLSPYNIKLILNPDDTLDLALGIYFSKNFIFQDGYAYFWYKSVDLGGSWTLKSLAPASTQVLNTTVGMGFKAEPPDVTTYYDDIIPYNTTFFFSDPTISFFVSQVKHKKDSSDNVWIIFESFPQMQFTRRKNGVNTVKIIQGPPGLGVPSVRFLADHYQHVTQVLKNNKF